MIIEFTSDFATYKKGQKASNLPLTLISKLMKRGVAKEHKPKKKKEVK